MDGSGSDILVVMRDDIYVTTWLDKFDMTVDLLVLVVRQTEFSHLLCVCYQRLLIAQHSRNDFLPMLLVPNIFKLSDDLLLLLRDPLGVSSYEFTVSFFGSHLYKVWSISIVLLAELSDLMHGCIEPSCLLGCVVWHGML